MIKIPEIIIRGTSSTLLLLGSVFWLVAIGVNIGGLVGTSCISPNERFLASLFGTIFLFIGIYSLPNIPRNIKIAIAFTILFVIIYFIFFAIISEIYKTSSRYDFEIGTMGWKPIYWIDAQASTLTNQSSEKAQKGNYSLKMEMNLIGRHPNNSRGGVWVDMEKFPPQGAIPINLEGKKITAWVFAPLGSRGNISKPNGFQLFVRDRNGKSAYSWDDIVEEQWFQISLDLGISKHSRMWMDEGFNPKQIIAVGVVMSTGEGSTAKYNGPVYIDEVDW